MNLSSELWVMGRGWRNPTRLTYNAEEERGPAWSPDGTCIVYMCRRGPIPPNGRFPTFEICVIHADGTGELRLANNSVPDLTPNWSLDSQRIVFHRDSSGLNDLFQINTDGTGETEDRVVHVVTRKHNPLSVWRPVGVLVDLEDAG